MLATPKQATAGLLRTPCDTVSLRQSMHRLRCAWRQWAKLFRRSWWNTGTRRRSKGGPSGTFPEKILTYLYFMLWEVISQRKYCCSPKIKKFASSPKFFTPHTFWAGYNITVTCTYLHPLVEYARILETNLTFTNLQKQILWPFLRSFKFDQIFVISVWWLFNVSTASHFYHYKSLRSIVTNILLLFFIFSDLD